jgi:anti-anti-sigma factor
MSNATLTRTEDRVMVQPNGDVTAPAVPELREVLRGAVAEGVREVVLDLSNAKMLDSCGIGLLIAVHNSLRKAGGKLGVIHASQEIVALLQAMRIHQHFSVTGA